MQELIARAKELLADGTVTRVLAGKPETCLTIRKQHISKQQKAWTNLSIMVSADKT